jgi:glyoxylase-like metal-dependent hydrolase (beta-lactamase superfamily II)
VRWTIGDVEVTRVAEMLPSVDLHSMMLGSTAEGVERHRSWLEPHFLNPDGTADLSIHAFVVRSEGATIVVDTCVGNDKHLSLPGMSGLSNPFLDDLTAAGCPPESVDTVLCTHLHFDHVGWNTVRRNGTWEPTFPNARYLFSRIEWEHWQQAATFLDSGTVLEESVRPVVDAGLADLVEVDHRLTGEVRLEHTPGHTPGHCSVRITSGGQSAVITGDCMHHPVQIAEPTWAPSADGTREQAAATRKALADRYGDTPTLVLGTHFAPPTAGRIVQRDGGWRFQP